MKISSNKLLKLSFVVGAVVDSGIAISWFLISEGVEIPNILNGHVGSGSDYQLSMFIGAMFMAGWAVLLAWGSIIPMERRGLLLITAGFLLLSVIAETILFGDVLGGTGFIFGVSKRIVLSGLFIAAYYYSLKTKSLFNNS